MTNYSLPMPSINGDRKIGSAAWRFLFNTFFRNGIFPNPSTNLQVLENGNMTTVVKAGRALIEGVFMYEDQDMIFNHDLADGLLKRIDRIVVRLDNSTRTMAPALKKGTFASNPVAPAIQRDGEVYEIVLADVLISNGVTQITQTHITDQRFNAGLCGVVKGSVEQIDTTELFAQYDASFNEWFATVQDILEGDVAGNLQVQITQMNSKLSTLEETVPAHITDEARHITNPERNLWNGKINASEKGKVNGVATLNQKGVLSENQIPPSLLSFPKFTAGDNPIYTVKTGAFPNSTTYTLVGQKVKVLTSGTIRLTFTLNNPSNAYNRTYGRIYINNIPTGIEREVVGESVSITFTEDFVISAGDTISLLVKCSSTSFIKGTVGDLIFKVENALMLIDV